MSPKGFAYWVALQLVLDLGLFILLIWLIVKLRELGRPLPVPGPNPVEKDRASCRKTATKESGTGKKPASAQWAGLFQQVQHPEPVLDPGFLSRGPDSGKSLHVRVEDLAAQGLSPEEIAHRLNLQPAEVKIALGLSKILAENEN
uniref:Uncharacterized protein n=1 Tax=Desulfobacca acetoxidans TaxID=60893 RepID=A0A7C5EMZ0_9BACT